MHNKSDLEKHSIAQLKEFAQNLSIPVNHLSTKEDLINAILNQKSPAESSQFFAREEKEDAIKSKIITPEPAAEGSQFFTREDNKEPHIPKSKITTDQPQTGGSQFFTNTGDQSGFITSPNYTNNTDSGSAFQYQADGSMLIGGSIIIRDPAQPYAKKSYSVALNLKEGDQIILKGEKYEITAILSSFGQSLEAVIYKVKNETGEQRVVKMYPSYNDPQREPNGEALERIKEIVHKDVLKLYDYGINEDKLFGQHCFEISEFAKGGSLVDVKDFKARYTYDFIQNHLIPDIFHGINQLHQSGIIHCDLKPRNVFYLDETQNNPVIGDYGSAKTRKESERRSLQVASQVIGTQYYLAPEQRDRVISEKNDYYSLGMILIHLLYPEQFVMDSDFSKVDPKKFEALKLKQYTRKKILNFNPAYSEVNRLIEGLTLYSNPQNRWGEKQVKEWLKGGGDYIEILTDTSLSEIKVDKNTIIYTNEDLVKYIDESEDWYDNLIQDNQGFNRFMSWLANKQSLVEKREIETLIINRYKEDGKIYLGEAIKRYFFPTTPIQIEDKTYDFLSGDLLETINQFFGHLDQIWKTTPLTIIIFHLFQLELSLSHLLQTTQDKNRKVIRDLLHRIKRVLNLDHLAADTYDVGIYQAFRLKTTNNFLKQRALEKLVRLFYLFQPNRGFRPFDNTNLTSLEEMGTFYAKNRQAFTDPFLRAEKDVFLEKTKSIDFVKLDYANLLFRIFSNDAKTHIELIELKVHTDREYEVKYKYQQSLNEWLQKEGIQNELSRAWGQPQTFKQKAKIFQGINTIFDNFINHALKKHHLGKASISSESLEKLKNQFSQKALRQKLGIHLIEVYSGFLLLLPILGLFGLFAFTNNEGQSFLQQFSDISNLGYYMQSPEDNNYWWGFYFILFLFIVFFVFALIPKLWFKAKWEVINKNNNYSVLLLMMALFPVIFGFSNWLYEILGILLIGAFALVVFDQAEQKNQGEHGVKVLRFLGINALAISAFRLGLEIYAWTSLPDPWSDAVSFRGLTEIIPYFGILATLLLVPVLRQLFRLHTIPSLLLKSALIFILLLVFSITEFSFGGVQKRNWLEHNFSISGIVIPEDKELTDIVVPDIYLADMSSSKNFALNIRSGPGTEHPPVGEVNKENTFFVKMIATSSWWEVIDSTKKSLGYIYAKDNVKLLRKAREVDFQ